MGELLHCQLKGAALKLDYRMVTKNQNHSKHSDGQTIQLHCANTKHFMGYSYPSPRLQFVCSFGNNYSQNMQTNFVTMPEREHV